MDHGLVQNLVLCILIFTSHAGICSEDDDYDNYFGSSTTTEEPEEVEEPINPYDSCLIETAEEVGRLPWMNTLAMKLYTDKYIFWPVVIIDKHLLITSSQAFQAPNRKLRIPKAEERHYFILLNSFKIPKNDESDAEESDLIMEVAQVRPYKDIASVADYWMKAENGFVLLHLKKPINFTKSVRRLCLPKWNSTDFKENENQSILEPGEKILLHGWKCSFSYSLMPSLAYYFLQVQDFDTCNANWIDQAEFSDKEDIFYNNNRVCGTLHLTKNMSNNIDPGFCANKVYYGMVKDNDTGELLLIGTFNGFAQRQDIGQQVTAPTSYFSLLTPEVLTWINNNINCGPDKFTCNNGECLELDTNNSLICNQVYDCKDKSDEDPVFCRSRNYCSGFRFECGVYGPCIESTAGVGGKVPAYCDGVADCPNGEDEDPHIYNCAAGAASNNEKLWSSRPWIEKNWVFVVAPLLITIVVTGLVGVWLKVKAVANKLYLTEMEIFEFHQGTPLEDNLPEPESPTDQTSESRPSLQLNSMQMPYIYSIEKDKFKFGREIGSGAFGKVYEGFVERKPVAIKVLKKELGDKEMFKTFLIELKIMAYVNFIHGGHENVIRLIGAYTDEIRDLMLYIAVEYCPNGSVSDYLKKNTALFQQYNEAECEVLDFSPSQCYVKAVTLQQNTKVAYLNRWSKQIADGMCFLTSLRIAHGDLAARNILLDYNLNAKISDFGLSRQIYYYNLSSCAKVDKDTSLPWRWMAPEVISNMKISPKSDVWSFGVTLWEMYTIGAVPYGGINWTPNFINQLQCGLRLAQPIYANDELFALIKECWFFNAKFRPDFETIKTRLEKVFDC